MTALSLAFAGALTGAGFSVAVGKPSLSRAALAGVIIGAGVGSMHYTGMWALEFPGRVTWDPALVAASILFGILLASAAMAVATRYAGRGYGLAAALLLTLAIVSHHFTAMGAVDVIADHSAVVLA